MMKNLLFFSTLFLGALSVTLGPTIFTFNVTVGTKTSNAPNQGGWAESYFINGFEQPDLLLHVGFTYTFNVENVPCSRAFYLSTDLAGNGASDLNTAFTPSGITTPGTPNVTTIPVCQGANNRLQFRPNSAQITANQPNSGEFYYQSFTNSKMGWKIKIRVETPCDRVLRLGTSLNGTRYNNSLALMTETIDVFFDRVLLNTSSTSHNYFKGGGTGNPYPTKNFTTQDYTNLKANHVAFWGEAFACSDGSIPAYTGRTLTNAHSGMRIAPIDFNSFIEDHDKALVILNRNPIDKNNARSVLNGYRRGACNDPLCRYSLCDSYADLNYVNATVFLNFVVTRSLELLSVNLSSVLVINPYFAGKYGGYNYSRDPSHTSANSVAYIDNVSRYVGEFLMNCSSGILPYTDSQLNKNMNLSQVHARMPIGQLEYNSFVDVLLIALDDYGVLPADQDTLAAYLDSQAFRPASICNQVDCFKNISGSFVVSAKTKSDNHTFYGCGSTVGFSIDGVEGAELFLEVGKTYVFQNNADCQYPLYISTSISGPIGNDLFEIQPNSSLVRGALNRVCESDRFTFTPTAQMKNSISGLYYQCARTNANCNYMGGAIQLCDGPGKTGCTSYNSTLRNCPTTQAPSTQAPSTSSDVDGVAALVPFVFLIFAALLL